MVESDTGPKNRSNLRNRVTWKRYVVTLVSLGILLAGALYLNHLSAGWVPDAEKRVLQARQQNAAQGLTALREQLRSRPTDFQTQLSGAQGLADAGFLAAALAPAEQAFRLDPHSVPAELLLARIYAALDYREEASSHFRSLIRSAPDEMTAYQGLGDLLVTTGRTQEAEQVFQQARRRAPSLPGPAISLAGLYLEQGRVEDGLKLLEPFLSSSSTPPPAFYLAGEACRKRGLTQRAVSLLRRAADLQTNFDVALYSLGSLLTDQGQGKEAVSVLQQAVTIAPGNPAYRFALGKALQADYSLPDRAAQARSAYEKALELDPRSETTHYYYGVLLQEAGENPGAIREYRRALELNPKYGSAGYRLGILYRSLGRTEEARRYLTNFSNQDLRAIERVHGGRKGDSVLDTAEAHYERAMRLLKAGNRREARADLQAALSRNPDHAPSKHALAALDQQR